MLTKSLARELAPEVRVNAIAPGTILWPEGEAEVSAAQQQEMLARIPLRRAGSPDDIARTALFLIRDAGYINGQVIAVCGGRTVVVAALLKFEELAVNTLENNRGVFNSSSAIAGKRLLLRSNKFLYALGSQ